MSLTTLAQQQPVGKTKEWHACWLNWSVINVNQNEQRFVCVWFQVRANQRGKKRKWNEIIESVDRAFLLLPSTKISANAERKKSLELIPRTFFYLCALVAPPPWKLLNFTLFWQLADYLPCMFHAVCMPAIKANSRGFKCHHECCSHNHQHCARNCNRRITGMQVLPKVGPGSCNVTALISSADHYNVRCISLTTTLIVPQWPQAPPRANFIVANCLASPSNETVIRKNMLSMSAANSKFKSDRLGAELLKFSS